MNEIHNKNLNFVLSELTFASNKLTEIYRNNCVSCGNNLTYAEQTETMEIIRAITVIKDRVRKLLK